jgi:septum formation topological specificity factor MinE
MLIKEHQRINQLDDDIVMVISKITDEATSLILSELAKDQIIKSDQKNECSDHIKCFKDGDELQHDILRVIKNHVFNYVQRKLDEGC